MPYQKDEIRALLQEAGEGNIEAFELLYERYAPLVFRIA
jgi:DNA-directed RNA polymerase specialized sigma subunit